MNCIMIKPLSVNKVWQGRRFRTKEYDFYQRQVMLMLPKLVVKGDLRIDLVFGFSSKLADIDNPLKPFLDILCKKYDFDDRQIFELNVKKEIVTKGNEFINFKITEIKNANI